jgi:hypothetical protein
LNATVLLAPAYKQMHLRDAGWLLYHVAFWISFLMTPPYSSTSLIIFKKNKNELLINFFCICFLNSNRFSNLIEFHIAAFPAYKNKQAWLSDI